MPRKKTAEQLALSAQKPKNQSTQYNFYAKVGRNVGLQTTEMSKLFDSKPKTYFRHVSIQFDTIVMKSDKEVGTEKPVYNEIGIQFETLNSDANTIETQTETKAASTQSEIFGIFVPPEKWDEINNFVVNGSRKYTRKRKLVNKQTSTDDDISKIMVVSEGSFSSVSSFACSSETKYSNQPDELTLKRLPTLTSALTALEFYFHTLKLTDVCFKRRTSYNGESEYIEASILNGMIAVSTYHDSPIKLIFSSTGKVTILISFKVATEFEYFDHGKNLLNLEVVKMALLMLGEDYVFCPGISKDDLGIIEETKKLQKIVYPFERFQSKECMVWFIPPANTSKEKLLNKTYQCAHCRSLKWYIKDRTKKKQQVTMRTKLRRQAVNSKCRMSILTTKTKEKRLLQNRQNRFKLTKTIKLLENKLRETSLQLSENQDKKMSEVVSEINLKGQEDLEHIFKVAMKKNKTVGYALKAAWEMNSKREPRNDLSVDKKL